MKQHLFFIAIILPAEICDAITEFKREVADRFQSKAALKLVPHITLKAPFKLLPADSVGVINWFETMPVTIQPFEQKLQDFGGISQ